MKKENESRHIATYTLGCKVNQYDTEAVVELFKGEGYKEVGFDEKADVYIVNTCTVTHLSDRKCRQMLRKTKKLNPDSVLIAMGCYAQSAGEQIKIDVPEVDLIVGTNKRNEMIQLIENYKKDQETYNYVGNIMDVEEFEELHISNMGEHTRAYLKIQEGCNNYCTYCIIPYVRGKIRSRKIENVMQEANRLVEAGFKEIILTGIHVASYGKDLGNTSLVEAIKAIHDLDGLERIRLSSIEPVVVTPGFLEAIQGLPKLCHHFHLSLQSGCDTVLKRMNRKYTTLEYKESVVALRNIWPDVAITTDIIVGFPGETEEEFQETVDFAKAIGFAQVHLFPYSVREGTVAAKMKDQLDAPAKDRRLKTLKEVTDRTQQAFIEQFIGTDMEVLFEKDDQGKAHGYTSNYIKVEVASECAIVNTLKKVHIESKQDDALMGKCID
ncbi:MAG: tRNA (N(6)-L-threonylcarbamoyladenosine(37)-C(2))-methylthiotransferase MtaB [Niameybacter sp.]|uniref:tRNA (N(6)-L-threonylcarbamoyladenosine(37)-C(2))- methylthiotransferase MtaB n=2 Tax=Niameybacter sp. TaxID=2033640 RepID=UPI002FC9BF6F